MNDLKKIEQAYQTILSELDPIPSREGVAKTPARAAKALQELTSGYQEDITKIMNGAIYESTNDEMVILKDIKCYSLCEHHLLPFFGSVHIGYLPNKKVIGVSKLARIVDHFAKRFQIQENLTEQIASCLMEQIDAKGVGVIMEAQHLCMMMRGIQKQETIMSTSMMLGAFRTDEKTRLEFLNLVKSK